VLSKKNRALLVFFWKEVERAEYRKQDCGNEEMLNKISRHKRNRKIKSLGTDQIRTSNPTKWKIFFDS